MKHLVRHAACVALASALSACGGGGSDNAGFTPTSAAGLYERSGGATPAFEVLVLDSGRTYAIYGMNASTPVPAGGVIVTNVATSGTSFTASDVRDFNLSSHTLSTGTAAGSFVAKTSITGTVSYSGGTSAGFGGSYNTAFDQPAALSSLAATYGGETADLSGTKASIVTVDASGLIAGTSTGGCTYAGLAAPHSSGHVFDVTLTFRSGCTEDGNTLRGHAFVSHNVLYLVVLSGDLNRAVLFAGVKS
jgi:hypothetical protein